LDHLVDQAFGPFVNPVFAQRGETITVSGVAMFCNSIIDKISLNFYDPNGNIALTDTPSLGTDCNFEKSFTVSDDVITGKWRVAVNYAGNTNDWPFYINQFEGFSESYTPPVPQKLDESEYKDLAYVSQSTYKTRIDELKSGIETAENSLTGLKYTNPSSQEKLELAWTHLYNAQQHLEDAERRWSGGNYELGKNNFKHALDLFKKIDSSSVKVGTNLKSITMSIGAAENWEREYESPKESASQQEEKKKFESIPRVPDFINPEKGAQYYLNRYYNQPVYKEWFDRNYPDYTIEQAIVIAIPDALSQKEEPKEKPKFCFLFWCW